MTQRRLVLLVTSPRVAPGILTRPAWQALEDATEILGRDDDAQVEALREAGVEVRASDIADPGALARHLVDTARERAVVWVLSSDGDPGLTDGIAAEVSRPMPDEPPEVELVLGSYDVPGAALLDVVAVMDRLRSPGGCPWDAEQTHASLAPYLLEEAHEAVEAMESGDRTHLLEELGDVLLQVAFHARVAEEHPEEPFSIDEVAAALVAKLVRRHPHVFGDGDAATATEVEHRWDAIKAQEKPERTGLLDGVPPSMSTLARAEKALSRAAKRGAQEQIDAALAGDDDGAAVLRLVAELAGRGVSADAALRATLRTVSD